MSIRLIDTERLCLTSYMSNEAPEYAILSHTWIHGEELTFQEMMAISSDPNHSARSKPGYAKIADMCRVAHTSGIAHAWVDTCCIDKTSSSELSEAINSMYHWYQKAKICYAFLSDFHPGSTLSESTLRRCRWFTRGWCLQELIAPLHLVFFDSEWNQIDTKSKMAPLLSRITQIDEAILLDGRLVSSVPIARRMSWASNRETTREEDRAYSLLGIFNINMPMLYGEGTRAFARLQHEIIKTSNDLSIFAIFEGSTGHITTAGPSREESSLFCNMFGQSPKDFASCGEVQHTNLNDQWENAYSLTNKGLHFPQVTLQVHLHQGLYSILLNCASSTHKQIKIFLRKVGPSLYARINEVHVDLDINGMDTNDGDARYTQSEQDIYIITTISREMMDSLVRSDEYAVHVRSNQFGLHNALQVFQRAASSDRWDPSRMYFLSSGTESFDGYWKVFPSLIKNPGGDFLIKRSSDSSESQSQPFYLMCRLIRLPGCLEPRVSVRLLSLDQWRNLERNLGILLNLNDVMDAPGLTNATDSLVFRISPENFITVSANISLHVNNNIPRFELQLDFE